jgi:hypothetical protein
MAETLVENKKCDTCGADVRPGSLFCYNCGGAVSEEGRVFAKDHHKVISASQLKIHLSENNDLKTTKLKQESLDAAADYPIQKPTTDLSREIAGKTPETRSIQEDAKLKSAANLRRKSKSFQPKTVEVIWEEPESAPNKWFPLVAIVLILFVIAIFYLALYLK